MANQLRGYNNTDPEFVVATFVSSIGDDPHHPKHCAVCIIGCILSLSHRDLASYNITILRQSYAHYYDACIRFITVTRSDEENARLAVEMERCECGLSDTGIKKIHENGRTQGTSWTYTEAARKIALEVHNVLQPVREAGNVHKVAKNHERAAREGTTVPWPATPQDLLPFGPDASIAAIGTWLDLCWDVGFLALIASIMDIFKQQLIPPFLNNPTLSGRIVGVGEIPWMTWLLNGNSGSCHPSRGPSKTEKVAFDVKRIAALLNVFACYCTEDDIKTLNRRADEQHGRDILSFCQWSIQYLPELAKQVPRNSQAFDDTQDSLQIFMAVGSWIHHLLDLPFDTNKYGTELVLNSLSRSKMASRPAITAYEAYLRLWYAERCWAPGCQETFASSQRKFRYCSGCKRVSYCSKECQTVAWKHKTVPHRAICSTLCHVAQVTQLEAKPPAENKYEFEKICKRKKVEDTALADITVHMKNLLKELSNAPSDIAVIHDAAPNNRTPAASEAQVA